METKLDGDQVAAKPPAMLTRADLGRDLSQALDIPIQEAEPVLRGIIAAMVDGLRRDGRIEIRGFGVFWLHHRAPRTARNPKTGAKVEVPAKKVVHFKPSKEIARLLNPGKAALGRAD